METEVDIEPEIAKKSIKKAEKKLTKGKVRNNIPEEEKLCEMINEYRAKNQKGPLRLDSFISQIGENTQDSNFQLMISRMMGLKKD